MHTNREAIEAGEAAVRSYDQQAAALRGEHGEIRASLQRIREQRRALCMDIVLSTLGEVTPDSVAIASAQFGALRLPVLLRESQGLAAQQQAVIVAAERDPSFAALDALIAASGARVQDLSRQHSDLGRELARYDDCEDFLALHQESLPAPPPNLLWAVVWKVFLFGWFIDPFVKRARAAERAQRLERVTDLFENSLLEAIVDRYNKLPAEIERVNLEGSAAEGRRRELSALKDRHQKAVAEKARLEAALPDEVRSAFATYLGSCEAWVEIRARVGEEFRLTISTIIALAEKMENLEQMSTYLGKEARDRDQRAGAIRRVIPKWRKKPHARLKGDKTKWLVDGPARLAQKTTTSVSRVHVMHETVYVYDNYTLFDRMVDRQIDFMIWDMIVHDHHGHFVPMGFCNEVLPEVAQFHEQNPEAVAELNGAYAEVGDPATDDASAIAAAELSTDGGELTGDEIDASDTDDDSPDSIEDVS